ncbi:hypothetical protein GCM10023169_12080 [Georgenia halophila]|uniref:DUF4097 domain-containing protein n=1 Tax=Georgenia halophila TaxID=620889 RepID=A0ABP8L161_9MICO
MATRSWIVSGPSQHQLDGVTRLRVQLVAGSVDVRTHDDPHVWVDVTDLRGNPLELTVENGRLTVGYPSIGWDGWVKRLRSYSSSDSARLTVRVPRGTAVTAATASADAYVADLAEDIHLNTATGALVVTGSRGAASLRSASSDITVSGHDGPVTATTAAGRVSLGGDLPRADVNSVSGFVEVRSTAQTSKVGVGTVSGDMLVALPAGTGVSLTARSLTGAVRLDGADRKASGFGATTLEDRTDGGICFLTSRSVSGSLDVTRTPTALPGT